MAAQGDAKRAGFIAMMSARRFGQLAIRLLAASLIATIFGIWPAAAAPVNSAEDNAATLAFRIIREHRLLAKDYIPCVFLMLEDEDLRTVAKFAVRERHKPWPRRCDGAPDVAPRLFSLEIDLRTGHARWDRITDDNPAGDMRPVPKRR